MQPCPSVEESRDEAARVSRVLWSISALILALAALAGAAARLEFAHFANFARQFFLYIGLMVCVRVYARWRGLGDERLALCIDIAATFGLNALGNVVLQYAAATLPAPDVTAWAQRADHALGFDWFAYARVVSALWPLRGALTFVYANWMAVMVLAMAALALRRRYREIAEFGIAFTLTCLAIILVFAALDIRSLESVAAYRLPGLHPPGGAGPHYLHALSALRSGASRTLDFDSISPLISFPSLHGATALLLVAATRNLGVWRCPFFVYYTAVVVSTLSEGGHDAVDVVAGGATALAAIAASQSLYRALGRGEFRKPWRAAASV